MDEFVTEGLRKEHELLKVLEERYGWRISGNATLDRSYAIDAVLNGTSQLPFIHDAITIQVTFQNPWPEDKYQAFCVHSDSVGDEVVFDVEFNPFVDEAGRRKDGRARNVGEIIDGLKGNCKPAGN